MVPYIVTASGARLTRDTGVPEIRDVILNHCRTPMYAGATHLFQSVAHHCLGAAKIAAERGEPTVVQLFLLWHEVECVAFGDIPGPVKPGIQRSCELDLRNRFYDAHLGRRPAPDTWDRVEHYDKVEQAAAAMWLGLPETAHQPVWSNLTMDEQRAAIAITTTVYRDHSPHAQLEVGSILAGVFRRYHDNLLAALAREKFNG